MCAGIYTGVMHDFFGFSNVDAGWQQALAPVRAQLADLAEQVQHRQAQGELVLPPPQQVLRCFQYPFAEVKVLLIGQDPYPTVGNAVGLSFSVAAQAQLPASLRNIFKELLSDLQLQEPGITVNNLRSPDLSDWAEQGVCLLNRVLTVAAGSPGAHENLGWQAVTEAAVAALVARPQPLVVILWGAKAQQLRRLIPARADILVIESAHPSPLSARRGFFGSAPFSRANQHLRAHGVSPVAWAGPTASATLAVSAGPTAPAAPAGPAEPRGDLLW